MGFFHELRALGAQAVYLFLVRYEQQFAKEVRRISDAGLTEAIKFHKRKHNKCLMYVGVGIYMFQQGDLSMCLSCTANPSKT